MALVDILNEIETAITDPNNGILKKIDDLANAADDAAKKSAIINLIGSLILLVIKGIKAAVS